MSIVIYVYLYLKLTLYMFSSHLPVFFLILSVDITCVTFIKISGELSSAYPFRKWSFKFIIMHKFLLYISYALFLMMENGSHYAIMCTNCCLMIDKMYYINNLMKYSLQKFALKKQTFIKIQYLCFAIICIFLIEYLIKIFMSNFVSSSSIPQSFLIADCVQSLILYIFLYHDNYDLGIIVMILNNCDLLYISLLILNNIHYLEFAGLLLMLPCVIQLFIFPGLPLMKLISVVENIDSQLTLIDVLRNPHRKKSLKLFIRNEFEEYLLILYDLIDDILCQYNYNVSNPLMYIDNYKKNLENMHFIMKNFHLLKKNAAIFENNEEEYNQFGSEQFQYFCNEMKNTIIKYIETSSFDRFLLTGTLDTNVEV